MIPIQLAVILKEIMADELLPQTAKRLELFAGPFPADYRETHSGHHSKAVLSSYKPNDVLRWIYSNLDADFLLRGISRWDWKEISKAENAWFKLCHERIYAKFFRNRDVMLDTARMVMSEAAREVLSTDESLLEDFTSEAFSSMRPFRRILRNVVENAQRFVLAGCAPMGVVAIPESDLWRAWKSYLGQYLRGKAEETLKAKERELIVRDSAEF